MTSYLTGWRIAVGLGCAVVAGMVLAQTSAPPAPPSPAPVVVKSKAASTDKTFSKEELQQIVAPIALYPDSLLAQVLMASTYPIEIVQAERWVATNKDLKGDALTAALKSQTWDPSVKSLVNFPQVLTMMSQQLEWTTKLGDAFIASQSSVMDAVQVLRFKAQAEGSLKDSEQQKVVVEKIPATQQAQAPGAPTQVIQIQPTSPEVVYVPVYNPTYVYGYWPYPAYPPYYYYPPGYVNHYNNAFWFGSGVALGVAWGYAWGNCGWNYGHVDIDVDRNYNYNRDINRNIDRGNRVNPLNDGGRAGAGAGDRRGTFQHDPSHRRGVSYRDTATAQRFGGTANADATKAREAFRGRSDFAGGAEGAGQFRNAAGAGAPARVNSPSLTPNVPRSSAGAGNIGAGGNRASAAPTPARTPSRSSAFDGASGGGAAARSSSSRGQASRGSMSGGGGGARMGGGGGGGGARGGGGGGRR